LLRAGLARRASGGWTRAVVQVEADNGAALHLYETLGFRPQWTRFRAQVG
jgi:ribosomal protein S18 acetylase RimI-like enzyme